MVCLIIPIISLHDTYLLDELMRKYELKSMSLRSADGSFYLLWRQYRITCLFNRYCDDINPDESSLGIKSINGLCTIGVKQHFIVKEVSSTWGDVECWVMLWVRMILWYGTSSSLGGEYDWDTLGYLSNFIYTDSYIHYRQLFDIKTVSEPST